MALAAGITCREVSSFKHMCCHDSSDVRRALTTPGNVAETLPGVVCCAVLADMLTKELEPTNAAILVWERVHGYTDGCKVCREIMQAIAVAD